MDPGRLATLRGFTTVAAMLLLLAAGGLAVGTAFNFAWFANVRTTVANLSDEARLGRRHLDDLRGHLGHSGFLQSLAVYGAARNPEALADMTAALDMAERSLRAFESRRLTPIEADLARDLRRILDSYRRLTTDPEALATGLSGPAAIVLPAQHAAIVDRIAELDRSQSDVAVDRLSGVAERGFWMGMAAVALLLAAVTGLLLLVRVRLVSPLRELEASVAAMARGDWRNGIWGTTRTDEFGALARAIDGFRAEVADMPDIAIDDVGGRTRLRFQGRASDLFQTLMAKLDAAGTQLTAQGRDVGDIVTTVRRDLDETLDRTREACADLARSAGDSNRELRTAHELLIRAAAEVAVFDASGPGGGLDAIVAGLRRNADDLAESLATASARVSIILDGLADGEAEMRTASGQARTAADELSEAMVDMQTKLLAAVKLMRASGELLAKTANDAGDGLSTVISTVATGERTLADTLEQAVARLDRAMNLATGRLDQAADLVGTRLDLAADLATSRVDTMTVRATGLVEEMTLRTGARLESAVTDLLGTTDRIATEGRETAERLVPTLDRLDGAIERLDAVAGDGPARLSPLLDRLDGTMDRLDAAADEGPARLAPALERLAAMQAELGQGMQPQLDALVGTLGTQAAELEQRGLELQDAIFAMAAELERRSAEPDRGREVEAVLAQLGETSAQLAAQVADVGAAAERLGGLMAGTMEEAGSRLRDATVDLQQESRVLAGDAAAATAALTRALTRQDDATETLKEVAAALTVAVATATAPPPPPEPDPLEAERQAQEAERQAREAERQAQEAERLAALAAAHGSLERALQSLGARLEGLDRVAEGLSRATGTLESLAQRPPAAADPGVVAARELGSQLANIADQLRATASGMQALTQPEDRGPRLRPVRD